MFEKENSLLFLRVSGLRFSSLSYVLWNSELRSVSDSTLLSVDGAEHSEISCGASTGRHANISVIYDSRIYCGTLDNSSQYDVINMVSVTRPDLSICLK